MNIKNLKTKYHKYLYKFFLLTFDDYNFERLQDFEQDRGEYDKNIIKSYKTFVKHNYKCINNLTDLEARAFYLLCKQIKKNKIYQADEESFVEFNTESFYFNNENKFVLMNYR